MNTDSPKFSDAHGCLHDALRALEGQITAAKEMMPVPDDDTPSWESALLYIVLAMEETSAKANAAMIALYRFDPEGDPSPEGDPPA